MPDMTCLAEGLVVPADFNLTGVNLNEVVVGPTGCGKSFSNGYSRLVHTMESTVVVPIAKKAIREKFSKMFKKRGYKVINLNYADATESNVGYDPLDYIHSDEDIIQLARNLVESNPEQLRRSNADPYWTESAISVLAAEISLIWLNAKNSEKSPCFADVIKLHRGLYVDYKTDRFRTNLDCLFEKAGKMYPGNQATELWKAVQGISSKTASCIMGFVNIAIDKISSENILDMTRKKRKVKFENLGKEKTALFITTSPMNKTLQNLVNIMYSDMFRTLFETAEKSKDGKLDIPVHIICDDFACGSRIVGFEDYISIFRAAGISVTMLLQSESQLKSMYGEDAATTIINNCDTYVYMGGMDPDTCYSISQRTNKAVNTIMSMPLEKVIVFRRGSKPFESRRYQLLNDPVYKEIIMN